MPELPEVETIRRQLDPVLTNRTVTGAWAFPSAKFTDAPAAVGARLGPVRRRGKYLLIGLSTAEPTDGQDDRPARELVVHLGMTGRLALAGFAPGRAAEPPAHLRAAWDLDDGSTLRLTDVRRFGRVAVVDAGCYEALPTLASLGPEPFSDEFDPEALRKSINRSRRAVKTQLLSQRPVAGVGNIYADEALWRAGVHPRARRLTRAQALRLRDAVRSSLANGIDNGGTTLRDYRDAEGSAGENQHALDCYGRWGYPCRRCGTTLRRCVIDARTTTFCPSCQRR